MGIFLMVGGFLVICFLFLFVGLLFIKGTIENDENRTEDKHYE